MIYESLFAEADKFAGEIEVDESYFGGVRKGKRGRGAAGKVAFLAFLNAAGKFSHCQLKIQNQIRSCR